ncbi:hypothetical protein CPB83DRAFT_848839 [Crepidotus variabilis]|uniref:F-box domain-containing protein n=1 Tax=Crepidotus variabilis TaxID=179855 RepID=A0A9P6EKA1_9AGAR|nr:hypothetical protein CPB83DRAFT_848839 [Crepidotus variabilis]
MGFRSPANLSDDFIPSDSETFEIKISLSERLTKLAEINAQVQELECQRQALLDERSALSSDIQKLRGFISLTRRGQIPDDILREIFFRCLPTNHDAIMHSREPPVLLTRICAGWRQLALSTPRLWASIHLPIPSLPHAPTPALHGAPYALTPTDIASLPQEQFFELSAAMTRRAEGVKEWLLRSMDCPTSVTIISRDYNGFNPFCVLMLNAILPFRSRWEKMTIVSMKPHLAPLRGLSASELPLLRKFEYDEVPSDPNVPEDDLQGFDVLDFLSTSSLRKLSVKRVRENISCLPVQWASLSSLTLHLNFQPNDMTAMIGLLQQCLHLKTCSIVVQRYGGDNFPFPVSNSSIQYSAIPVTLQYLETFVITVRGESNYPAAFDSLIMPNLRHLEFQWACYPGTPLRSLLAHSGQTLRVLNTSASGCSDDDFIAALRHCPHVTHFHGPLHGALVPAPLPEYRTPIDITDQFLELMSTPDEHGQILLPEVEFFDCLSNMVSFTDEALIKFIRKKQAGVVLGLSKLKEISIRFSRPQLKPIAELLKPYIEDGLIVKLSYLEPFSKNTLPSAYAFAESPSIYFSSEPMPPSELY